MIVNGTTAADTINYLPTLPGNGSITFNALPTVTFDAVESVAINGQAGGDTLIYTSPANAGAGSALLYAPGAAPDSGSITGHQLPGGLLTPLSFTNLDPSGIVRFATANGTVAPIRTDILDINGTAHSDVFNVTAANNGTVQIVSSAVPTNFITDTIQTPGVLTLDLHGLDGDDTFNLAGTLPYTSTVVDGGDPSASDIVNLTGATGLVTVNLADSKANPPTPPTDTTITGYGGTVTLTGVEVANLDAAGFGMTVNGTKHDDVITYTPTSPNAGTFQAAGLNTVFNFTTVSGTFLIAGGSPGGIGAIGTVGNTDKVIVQGTNSRDLFQIDQGARTVQVLAFNVNPLKTVLLDPTIQVLTALGLNGQDTFQVVPAAGIAGFAGDTSGINNLLINVDGGSDASGENNALVVQGTGGATLPATTFVVDNRGANFTSGTVRVFQSTVPNPDINYVNVQTVSPKVFVNVQPNQADQPNLLILGPDLNEPNEFQQNAAFVGSGSTLQIQHASIFPNSAEYPGVPGDNDYYRVVAQTTGTLDFQVYFKLYPGLLPQGGNLALEVLDAAGHVIGRATITPELFGTHGTAANARVRIPAVAGQSYYLHVFGGPNADNQPNPLVVNGYDATIIDTPDPVPSDLQLSRSEVVVTITGGGSGYTSPPTVTFSGGGATTQATGIAIISGGVVTGVQITSSGSGYTSAPAVAFSGGGFTVAATATASLGDTGDLPVNSPQSDSGRSQFDNITYVNNPTIYLRLDDAIFLHDLPGNQTPGGVPPMGPIVIPFNTSTTPADLAAQGTLTAGFRIAVYDGGNGAPAGRQPAHARSERLDVHRFRPTRAWRAPSLLPDNRQPGSR